MKLKNEKRYLTITKDNVDNFIEYIMVARNAYIKEGKPVEDVNTLLFRFLKIKKKLRA